MSTGFSPGFGESMFSGVTRFWSTEQKGGHEEVRQQIGTILGNLTIKWRKKERGS